MTLVCLLIVVAAAAQGSEIQRGDVHDVKMPTNPRIELDIDRRSFEKLAHDGLLEDLLCTGSERVRLPVFGECPDYPGYVTVGIATCTQVFEVPRKRTFEEIVPGFVRMVCELDYTNSVPVGAPSCDYSQCFYVEEPEFPLSETPLR
jgi:hypothetical protein